MRYRFYVDSCIYISLWQKEEGFGICYWRFAKDFFEKFDNEDNIIYYSGFVLKELKFILSKGKFKDKAFLFSLSPNFKRLYLSAGEMDEARRIESELNYCISFYDIIHIVLARKSGSILITRDKRLMEISEKYGVKARKPESFL